MRKAAFVLLVLLAFTIPWEGSLDFGEPVGTIARVAGVLLLLVAIPTVLQAGRLRTPGALQWLALALYLWFCCTTFWSVDRDATLDRLRGSFQVIMIAWLLWELAATPRHLRTLMRAYLAGAWVLAGMILASYWMAGAALSGQARFVAEGQDPNDAARFLVLALPMAGLLYDGEATLAAKALSLGYLPIGLLSVLLTASRGGFAGAMLALAGVAVMVLRRRPDRQKLAVFFAPAMIAAFAYAVPMETLQRLATLSEQVQGGDLNQRVNIWIAAWHVLPQHPFFGTGAGTFVSATGLAYIDTAHNTMLSLTVEGGIVSLMLAALIIAASVRSVLLISGPARIGLGTALAVLLLSALDATVEGNRSTWFLFGLLAVAARLAVEQPSELAQSFPTMGIRSRELLLPEAVR